MFLHAEKDTTFVETRSTPSSFRIQLHHHFGSNAHSVKSSMLNVHPTLSQNSTLLDICYSHLPLPRPPLIEITTPPLPLKPLIKLPLHPLPLHIPRLLALHKREVVAHS